MADGQEAWVFVSHASADLHAVRKVRNYLEDLGAAPLMFHLRSLQRPGQFWPIIKREIAHRNFFLYCESKAAEESEWVRRERSVVARIGSKRRIRVGHVNVESGDVDTRGLAAFMRQVRVFPTFRGGDLPRVEPYLAALRDAGFKVFDWRELNAATSHHEQSAAAILEAAEQGWIEAAP